MVIAMLMGCIGVAEAEEINVGVMKHEIISLSDLNSGVWRERVAGYDAVSLELAADVTVVPEEAFADCTYLVQVKCASGSRLKSVGKRAFMGCISLRSVILPATVNDIGERCFLECESLESFEVPAAITVISSHCFEWCKNLKRVTFPKGLKKISSSAFMYCFSLDNVVLPYGLTEIGSNAFTECRSLTELKIPASVRELGSYICSECVTLQKVTLPKGLGIMGELMFSGCRSLEQIVCDTTIPPRFECNSFIFEPDESKLYERCILKVSSPSSYRKAHGWDMFANIEK